MVTPTAALRMAQPNSPAAKISKRWLRMMVALETESADDRIRMGASVHSKGANWGCLNQSASGQAASETVSAMLVPQATASQKTVDLSSWLGLASRTRAAPMPASEMTLASITNDMAMLIRPKTLGPKSLARMGIKRNCRASLETLAVLIRKVPTRTRAGERELISDPLFLHHKSVRETNRSRIREISWLAFRGWGTARLTEI